MERLWVSHSQHLSLCSSVWEHSHTLSLSGRTASLSVTFLLAHDSGSQSVTNKFWERCFCHAPKHPCHFKRKSSFCLWIRHRAQLWPETRSIFFFWMPPLSIRHLPRYHLPLPSYLSLITRISFSPWAIATKAASRMFSKGDLKAWPIKWRQGQIFRLKQPDLLRHTERWREKE